jgi:hypothetical protein
LRGAGLHRSTLKLKTVFVHMENSTIWSPSAQDLQGIDIIVSPYKMSDTADAGLRHIRWFPCVPWFYGISFSSSAGLLHKPLASRMELDKMRCMLPPQKTKLLSIIVSGKQGTHGHMWRTVVANALKAEFNDLVDVYGFGSNPISDKRTALDPYIFSLVIENSDSPFYATEKIVDCLIAWTIPIYSGSGNVDDLLCADIPRIPFGCSPDAAVSLVKQIIRYMHWSDNALATARTKAMTELNIFDALPLLLE